MYFAAASQTNAHTKSILQKAHGLYDRASHPSSAPREDFCTPRSVFLPRPQTMMQSPTLSSVSDGCDMKRSGSANSKTSRRSVKVMKSLLPFKLASPRPQDNPSGNPPPIQRSIFELSASRPDRSASVIERRSKKIPQVNIPTIPREKYRETSCYSEVGSPRLDLDYNTDNGDEDLCSSCSPSGSSCDEACIINDYESSSEGEPVDCWNGLVVEFEDSASSLLDDAKDLRVQSSDLSFKCRGVSSAFGPDLFPDEAAWLSSSLPSSVHTRPRRPVSNTPRKSTASEHDIEGWLSEASSCYDEEDDELECATALAPAKAHVVDVSIYQQSVITVTVPPRTSSLDSPLTLDCGRKSRMTFRDSSDAWPQFPRRRPSDEKTTPKTWVVPPPIPGGRLDLARASPPISPVLDSRRPSWDSLWIANLSQFPKPLPNAPGGTLSSIISELEDATCCFPQTMLLPDTPSLLNIRAHLHHLTPKTQSPPSYPRYLNGVDWRPERPIHRPKTCLPPAYPRTASLSTLSTFKFSSSHEESPPALSVLGPTHFSLSPADSHLKEIFPASSSFFRAALYAHVLAYSCLEALTSPSPQLCPATSPSPAVKFVSYSIPITQSYALPSKVVSVLGAPPLATRPTRLDVVGGGVVFCDYGGVEVIRVRRLMESVRGCIGWLFHEMGGIPSHYTADDAVIKVGQVTDGLVLRSLIEVVRGCEERGAA